MPVIEIDTSDVDDDTVQELVAYLHEMFAAELDDGVTLPELLMAVGTVVTDICDADRVLH